MNEEYIKAKRQMCLNNPQPGDLWHERFQILLLVIGVIDNFIIISKAYNKDENRYLETNPSNFLVLTKEEFIKETRFCFPLLNNLGWVDVSEILVSLDSPDIKKLLEDKKQNIKSQNITEVKHFKEPQFGDVWNLKGYNSITIIDRYLKDYLIVSFDQTPDIVNIYYKRKQFTDIRILHYEEFKFTVMKNDKIEDGFSASVQPLYLLNAVNNFKQSN